jgi:hypothetical protein
LYSQIISYLMDCSLDFRAIQICGIVVYPGTIIQRYVTLISYEIVLFIGIIL